MLKKATLFKITELETQSSPFSSLALYGLSTFRFLWAAVMKAICSTLDISHLSQGKESIYRIYANTFRLSVTKKMGDGVICTGQRKYYSYTRHTRCVPCIGDLNSSEWENWRFVIMRQNHLLLHKFYFDCDFPEPHAQCTI